MMDSVVYRLTWLRAARGTGVPFTSSLSYENWPLRGGLNPGRPRFEYFLRIPLHESFNTLKLITRGKEISLSDKSFQAAKPMAYQGSGVLESQMFLDPFKNIF